MRTLIIPALTAVSLFLASCAPSPVEPPLMGVEPVSSVVTASTDSAILLRFRSNNNIPEFLGFNVYASAISNLSSVTDRAGPIDADVSLTASGDDPDLVHFFRLTNDSAHATLANGTRYYVWITAVCVQKGELVESPPSRIRPAVPLGTSAFTLDNQAVPSQPGDAVLIGPTGIPAPADCPDIPAVGTVSVYFRLQANAGGFSPYLSVFSNSTYIQDLGFSDSLSTGEPVPFWPLGFTGPAASVLLVQGHIIGLYDASSGLYAKIRVESAPPQQPSATAAVTCSLRFMIQTIPGVREF